MGWSTYAKLPPPLHQNWVPDASKEDLRRGNKESTDPADATDVVLSKVLTPPISLLPIWENQRVYALSSARSIRQRMLEEVPKVLNDFTLQNHFSGIVFFNQNFHFWTPMDPTSNHPGPKLPTNMRMMFTRATSAKTKRNAEIQASHSGDKECADWQASWYKHSLTQTFDK